MKILFVLATLACSSPLLAMDMDNPEIKNQYPRWSSQANQVGEILEEVITFRSRTTGSIYRINMRREWPLANYIKQLKKDGILSKAEGLYNYNAQYFFLNHRAYSANIILSYEDVQLLSNQQQVIEFKFH